MEGEYKVTLVVYSGVPDPICSVHSHHGNFEEMKQLLDDARAKGVAYVTKICLPFLDTKVF